SQAPRHPRPTLFPYTTLFRSREHPWVPHHLAQRLVQIEHLAEMLVDHVVLAGGADDQAEGRAGQSRDDAAFPLARLLGAHRAFVALVPGDRQAPRHAELLALRS